MARILEDDRQRLLRYHWTQKTELRIGGELRDSTSSRLEHDTNGTLRATPITDEGPEAAQGRSRKRRKQTAELSDELGALVRSYTEFTPERMDSLFERAKLFAGNGDEQSTIRVQMRSFLHEGDSMHLWLNEVDKRIRRIEIQTSHEGAPVHATAEFRELTDGPSYPAQTVIDTELRGKPVVIETKNFDHALRED